MYMNKIRGHNVPRIFIHFNIIVNRNAAKSSNKLISVLLDQRCPKVSLQCFWNMDALC